MLKNFPPFHFIVASKPAVIFTNMYINTACHPTLELQDKSGFLNLMNWESSGLDLYQGIERGEVTGLHIDPLGLFCV